MEKLTNSYESMFIVSLANGEEAAKTVVNKFTDLISANAEVVKIDEWGKRRFAYPIQDMNEGFYTLVTFKADGAFPAELQRLMNIDEAVLRAMVIKLEYDPATVAETAPVAEEATEAAPAEEAVPAADAE
ncbi:MAG: 30S ribosomal protein S6 [Clostridia bacterium]|nr:30S ribosomal protein S6 [Clostridia bacterium]